MSNTPTPEQAREATEAVSEMMGEQVPPMPERKPKLVIAIEIDDRDIDSARIVFEGTAIDAVEALYVGGKYDGKLVKPIIGAAAMFISEDPSLRKVLEDVIAYHSSIE